MLTRSKLSLGLFVLCAGLPAAARAQKMDKDEKKWLEDVRTIILIDEEKTYRSLKSKADRQEFQKIFWARRDPNLETPENEYQADYQTAVRGADGRFRVMGQAGSTTDCGRVFILLGEPDDVKKEIGGESQGGRYPEVWIYRDRPGQTFQGGQAEIAFDAECRAQAARMNEQLNRVAEARIAHPNIGYRFTKDGRLVTLVDQLPKPTPAQALLKSPRQDFPVATQVAYLKVQDGGTAVLGLVHGSAEGLTVEEKGGKKAIRVVVAAQAVGEDGKPAAFAEEKTNAELQPDGSFLASYRMGLKPGKYTMHAGALDEKTGKGALASIPIDVPNLNRGELSMATLLILKDVQDMPENAPEDRENPFSAFILGRARLVPRFGTKFAKSDALSFFYQVYDLKVDEATGKASGVAILTLLKDGKTPVARAPEQTLEMPVSGSVVGPVPLDKYEPGPYVVQLKVKDKLANKEDVQEIPFELKP
jgi:GWxTD domain-containing protein